MGLFACDNCNVIENTATSRYWLRNTPDGGVRALCSECDPDIGKWHGLFPRVEYDGSQDVKNRQPLTDGSD